MASGQLLYAEVLLPIPLDETFTFIVPETFVKSIKFGHRVMVEFGRMKSIAGLVVDLHQNPPEHQKTKEILEVLDQHPIIHQSQLDLWRWMSKYYMSSLGEVMNTALPLAFKLQSETLILANNDFDPGNRILSSAEEDILQALQHQEELKIADIEKIVGNKKYFLLLKEMINDGMIIFKEEVSERFSAKKANYLRINKNKFPDHQLDEQAILLEKKAPKQFAALLRFISESSIHQVEEIQLAALTKFEEVSAAAIEGLVKKEIFLKEQKTVSRLKSYRSSRVVDSIQLSEAQEKALNEIKTGLDNKKVTLIHGITSSGKTEIYIRLINEIIEEGKQVLFLLPEIALTTQIIERLRKYFGHLLGVYHSRFNPNERVEIWKNVYDFKSEALEKKHQIIIGARSALFLPFSNLGLVIVDEEHDGSFKQFEHAPLYHARDTAIMLASLFKASTLLGSATPSLESYYNAKVGKYHYVELKERYGQIEPPQIIVEDIKKNYSTGVLHTHFTVKLRNLIEKALENKEQIILFQNRRGFAVRMECDTCHWMPQCRNCDVTLTYHKKINALKCHYCGFTKSTPVHCDDCGSKELKLKGFGTEKIEEVLGLLFPDAKVARLDLDTTRRKNAFDQILKSFEDRVIDILVGTQMVSKGLDFENVSVVGIMNADNMLSFPDFRSYERSFQQLAQVSGRAGRKNKQGQVVVQTYSPDHFVINKVKENDLESLYRVLLNDRKKYNYPPYSRMIKLTLKHRDYKILNSLSSDLVKLLRAEFDPKDVLGPEYPMVARIRNYYLKNILLKIPKSKNINQAKGQLKFILEHFFSNIQHRGGRIIIDVDPR